MIHVSMTPRALHTLPAEGQNIWGGKQVVRKGHLIGTALFIFLSKSGGGWGYSPPPLAKVPTALLHMRELCSFVLFCYQTNLIENPGAPFQA